MKLVSMKRTEQMEKPEVAMMSENIYPYGLMLNLCDDDLKKLGIKDTPKVGTKMTLQAVVEVCCTSEHESKEGENKSMSLQITDMGLSGKKREIKGSDLYDEES